MTEQEFEREKTKIIDQAVAEQEAIPEVPAELKKITLHDGHDRERYEISQRALRKLRELKIRYDREKQNGQG